MSSRRRPPNSRTPARTRAPSAPRSALIAAQIVFVFMLFGLLQGLEASMRLAIRQSHAERMFVSSRLGSTDLLPVSLWRQLQKVPGVARVAFESQLPCTYRVPDNTRGLWASIRPPTSRSTTRTGRLRRTWRHSSTLARGPW